MSVGQRTNDDVVYDGEDRCGSADADRERDEYGRGEGGRALERPEDEVRVAERLFEHAAPIFVSRGFAPLSPSAEGDGGAPASFGVAQALLAELGREHVEMKAHLFAHCAVLARCGHRTDEAPELRDESRPHRHGSSIASTSWTPRDRRSHPRSSAVSCRRPAAVNE